MTASGPPWPVFGAGSPEPETSAAGKARPDRVRPPRAGPPWARQTSPEPTRAGPPWARQTSPEPTKADVVRAEPATAEPVRAEPVRAEPVRAEPVRAEPVRAEPVRAEPVRAEPVRAEPPWAGLSQDGAPETDAPRARLPGVPDQLTALTRLIQIGSARTGADGFSEELLRDAEQLEERAGERLRLSAGHTVVALARGTGIGKSALFNQLAGHDFSAVGGTRPVTREPHACVWGTAGAGPHLASRGPPRSSRYGQGCDRHSP